MTTPSSAKMICPKCRIEMNHHCDKLVHVPDSSAAKIDENLGGALEEFHSCPNCGGIASRPAVA